MPEADQPVRWILAQSVWTLVRVKLAVEWKRAGSVFPQSASFVLAEFSPSQPVLYWLCDSHVGGKIKKIKGPFYFFLAWITGRGEISPCTRGRVGEASAPVTMPGKTPETPVADSPVQFWYLYYRHRSETLNFTGPSMTTPFPPVGVAGHRYPSGPVELSIPPSSPPF